MIRNVIFDWSGTLVDDLPATWEATNHVFRQAGVPELSLDQFRAEFCLPYLQFYERHLPHHALPELEICFHTRFLEVQDRVAPLPHARDFLEYCRRQKLRTFVLSTVRSDHFATQARAAQLEGFFEHPYLGINDKRAKIHELLRDHALDASETVFIGDMQHDIETARHGGVFSCAVLTGYNKLQQLRASSPDLIVEHLGELRQLFERHQGDFGLMATHQQNASNGHPIATVGALVFDSADRVLMIRTQKWSHLWGIPGGKIQRGEASLDALRRELKEETNLDLRDIEFVLVQDCISSKEFYHDAHFILLNYVCCCHEPAQVVLNEEAEEFKWVTLPEALMLDLNQPTRILLEAVRSKRPIH